MAITKAHPRFKVEIVVNNIALEEFDDEEEPATPDAVTKYIESVSGAEFKIRSVLTKPGPGCSLMLDFYLDGKFVRGTYMMQKDFKENLLEYSVRGVKYLEDNEWFVQKFCFSDLKIDDSDVRAVSDQLMKDLKGMGEITVKTYRVKNLRRSTQEEFNRKDVNNVGDVPEKALKGRAVSHQSSFQPPVTTTASEIWEHEYMDSKDEPFAVFRFKYRSRAALKSLLIIPRSLSPVPLEERDVDTLTPEESRELIRRLRQRDEAAQVVKQEGVKRERSHEGSSTVNGTESDDSDEVSFVSAKRRRLPVIIDEDGVEVIDLT